MADSSRPHEPNDDSLLEDIREETRFMLRSWIFDVVIGSIIALNAVSISVEQSLEIKGHDTTSIKVIESVFLTIYIIELGLRFFALGLSALREAWVRFDLFLVILGIIQCWIIDLIIDDDDSSLLGPVMLLRTARLLRLCKTVRMLAHVQEFWMLIRGLMNSASIMLYTFAILFLVLFMFSSIAVEVITKSSHVDEDPEFRRIVESHFDTVPNTMITLLQFACMDHIAEIYRPLIRRDGWLAIYFVVLVIVCMVLGSLIGAVIFSTTMAENDEERDVAKKQQEAKWSELFGDMRGMFVRIDADKTGVLSKDNIMNMSEADVMALSDLFRVTDKADLLRILDREKKGYVTINEFFDRILETTMKQGSIDLTRMERQIESMYWRNKEVFAAQHDLHFLLRQLVLMMETLQPSIEDIRSENVEYKEAVRRISVGGESIFALEGSRRFSHHASHQPGESAMGRRKSLCFQEESARNSPHDHGADVLGLDRLHSNSADWAVPILDDLIGIWKDHVHNIMNSTREHLETALEKVAKPRSRRNTGASVSSSNTGMVSPDAKAVPKAPIKKKFGSRCASPNSDNLSVCSGDSTFSELLRAAKHNRPYSESVSNAANSGMHRQISPVSSTIGSITSAEFASNAGRTPTSNHLHSTGVLKI